MCAGNLLPKRAHKNAIFCHNAPSATEAGAQNVILCRHTHSGLSVTIEFHDTARHMYVLGQSAANAGAQKCHFLP